MIILFLLTIFTVFFIIKPKYTILFFVFTYPLMPKYINIELITSSVYITYQTSMLLIMLIVTLFSSFSNHYSIIINNKILQNNITIGIVLFILFKIFTTLLLSIDKSGGIVSIIYYTFDSLIIIFLFSIYTNNDVLVKYLLITILLSYIIVLFIGIFEKIYSENLFIGLTSLRYDFYEDIISGHIRSGNYRLMGSFKNTLLLTSFLSVFLPLVFYFVGIFKKKNIIISIIILFIAFISLLEIYWTYSRTGILLVSIFFLLLTLYKLYDNFSYRFKNIFIKLVYTFIFIFIIVIIMNFNDVINYFVMSSGDTGAKESISSRLNQYILFENIVKTNLLFGSGTTRNIINSLGGDIAIDNFYLRVFIESGLIGLLLYLSVFYFAFKNIRRLINISIVTNEDKNIIVYISFSLLLFIINLFLLSLPDNHIYLFMLIYIIIYYKNKYLQGKYT